MFHHQPQGFCKAEDCVGWFPPGIGEIRDSEKRPVNVVMTVDQKQFHPRDRINSISRNLKAGSWKSRYWILDYRFCMGPMGPFAVRKVDRPLCRTMLLNSRLRRHYFLASSRDCSIHQ